MELQEETFSFLVFASLGIIYGVIFDFFRALRKTRKSKDITVSIQDIVYFVIVGVILSFTLNVYMKDRIRIYNLLSIVLGVIVYVSIFGNKIMNLFSRFLTMIDKIIAFIFMPLDIFRQIFSKQIKFFKKFVVKCCNKFFYVIKSNYVNLMQKKNKLITKEGKICQEQVVFKKTRKKRKKLN